MSFIASKASSAKGKSISKFPVIPAQAGIHCAMDSRLRGNDDGIFFTAASLSTDIHTAIIPAEKTVAQGQLNTQPSFPRRRESTTQWTPAFAGVTTVALVWVLTLSCTRDAPPDNTELKTWIDALLRGEAFQNFPFPVIPAQAGIHCTMDSRLRGNDDGIFFTAASLSKNALPEERIR